jgi:hypothetical protein
VGAVRREGRRRWGTGPDALAVTVPIAKSESVAVAVAEPERIALAVGEPLPERESITQCEPESKRRGLLADLRRESDDVRRF